MTSDQETRTTIFQTLQPKLPDAVNTALFDVGDAIGAALRLTGGQGAYDENSGEPLDSDAETEACSLKAREQLEFLTNTIEGWQREIVEYVVEAYKEHLYYDASAGFEYHGIDQQQKDDELNGHFEGAYELASKLVPGLDKATVMEHGLLDLVWAIREAIPALRTEASKRWRYIPPMQSTNDGEREMNDAVVRAHEKLTEKEEILDLLLYHLENPAHAEAHHQSTPASGPPQNYRVVLYYAVRNPEEDYGAVVAHTSTESVAQIRIEDLESGARIGPMCPLQEEIDAGTLMVENIGREDMTGDTLFDHQAEHQEEREAQEEPLRCRTLAPDCGCSRKFGTCAFSAWAADVARSLTISAPADRNLPKNDDAPVPDPIADLNTPGKRTIKNGGYRHA